VVRQRGNDNAFVRDNPQWILETAAMTEDFVATPAMEHLVQGRLGV